jgi:hypothetical protein
VNSALNTLVSSTSACASMPYRAAVGADELDERELPPECAWPFSPGVIVDAEALVELLFALLELVLADRVAEDEVLDVVAKNVTSVLQRFMRVRAATRRTRGTFRFEVGIADLEREIARVRAEEIQLLERRVAGRARQAERDDHIVVVRHGLHEQAERPRKLGEVAIGQNARRLEPRAIDATAELKREVRPGHLFVDEERRPALIDGRRQRFGSDGVELAIEEPAAEGAREPARRTMRQHQLGFFGVVVEHRARPLRLRTRCGRSGGRRTSRGTTTGTRPGCGRRRAA